MSFYVTGGTLQSDAPSYVEREADRQLYEGLLEGDFCYVLTARQMGKSSLMVRTANRLRMAGVHVVALDLTALGGQNITAEQWYFGLLDTLGQELGLCDELEIFWQDSEHVGPLHRFMKSIRQIVLPLLQKNGQMEATQGGTVGPKSLGPGAAQIARPDTGSAGPFTAKPRLVIFVDEIDFVRSLPFSTDEFFAAIRECYNRRTRDSAYQQVTFCLLGVASPSDLVRDNRTTPFNIGRRIELNDFTPIEAAALAQGLEDANPEYRRSKAVLDQILYWTEGHPYLTQRLCRAVAEALRATGLSGTPMAESPSELVDRLCADLFFSARARERDDNLIFVRERLLRNDADLASLLDLYLKIWQGKRVMDDEFDPLINLLRLSGVAHVSQGRLHVRSRIYARVFDDEWVRSNMPEAELRRQREAYRRGVIWAASRSTVIIIALGLLIVVAVNKTSEAYLNQAKALRSSGQMGQRIKALDAIEKAKMWGILFPDLSKLRNEAIAALNLVDLDKRGDAIKSWPGSKTAPVLNATFSHYAVADQDGTIRILRVERKEVELELDPIGLPVRWLRFGSSDEYLAVGYGDEAGPEQRFVLWHLTDRSKIVELANDVAREGWDINRNGDRLAVGLSQEEVRFYSLPGGGKWLPGSTPDAARTEPRRMSCLRFDPSGRRLALASNVSLELYVWDFSENRTQSYLFSKGVVDVDWHPDGRQLACACENGDIYLVDLRSGLMDRLHNASANFVQPEVCFNRMGTALAAVCSDFSLRLWRPQNGLPILTSFDLVDGLNFQEGVSLRFSADDRRLCLNDGAGGVRLLKVESGREIITFHGEPGATDAFHSIGFDAHGMVLMAAGVRGAIQFWDTRVPRSLESVNLGGLVSTVGFDRDGTTLFASTTSGFFQLPLRYDRQATDEDLRVGPAQCLALRAGLGRFALATNGTAAVVHVGKTADQIQVFPLSDPDRDSWWVTDTKLDAIAMSPNGRWLFGYAGADRKTLVWDVFAGERSKPCVLFAGSRHLALSPSGRWLVTQWDRQFRFRRVGTWRQSDLRITQSRSVDRFNPVAFAALEDPEECLLAVATAPTTIGLYRFVDLDSPKLEKLAELESPDRLPIVSLAIDATFGRLAAGSDGQIVQVWNLAEIREELHQRGLASGLPKFVPMSSNRLRLTGETSKQSDEEKGALHAQEKWLVTVDEFTEAIKSAERNSGPGLFSNLVERAQRYRSLKRPELALRDLERALELRPEDEPVRLRKTAVEHEIKSKQPRPEGAAAAPNAVAPPIQ